ncbi:MULTISPECIES: hypothetical protein [Bacillus]|uniref:Uncharacterized protein n=1 Tax=Bacillus pacificus TaxID=2026187 RepID=A0A1Y5ZDL3_9BACI|nr:MULTISPECIES: hypothetical protein [Bacillus cereus group]AQQ65188.1 hypothetical Protein FORC21_4393 [Bacillus cereus]MBM6769249.1 hypothetical protein [Bacillus cereus]MCP1141773.1 hypothetical protein [Bacillus cereus]MCU5365123.1 hypothetical protein [Bacillus paranthracis]MDA1507904.1 hypothetical protein [Bacillus cereus group sp. TH36-2LC]
MGFFKDKEEMFNHRADRFSREADQYVREGKTEKAEWAKEQEFENREKADKYKGQDGW